MKKFIMAILIIAFVGLISSTTLLVEKIIAKRTQISNQQMEKTEISTEVNTIQVSEKVSLRIQRGWVKVSTHHCIINDSCDSKVHYPNNPNIKELKAKVTDIDNKFVTFSTSDGMGWVVENKGNYEKGDKVIITFDDKGTEELSDDEIIDESKQY
jgi:hypothetical protein